MANYKTCKKCGALLGGDDIAIYRKLVTRNADEFFLHRLPCGVLQHHP